MRCSVCRITLIIIITSCVFSGVNQRDVISGNGRLSSHTDSVYFHFATGTNSGDTTGMDIQITGNEGTNFGSEWFYGPNLSNPSQLHYLIENGSLQDVTSVPGIEDDGVLWTSISWDWNGGNNGQPLAPGNVWVVYTRTTHCYAVMEITQVNPWGDNAFSFDYVYQTNGSTEFPEQPSNVEDLCDDELDNDNDGLTDCDDDDCSDAPECQNSGLTMYSGTLSTHPDSVYFNFEQGFNSGNTVGMDVMITGNEGTNFGNEGGYFYDGSNWLYYPSFDDPSPIYFLSPDSSLELIDSVPEVAEDWPTVSWEWPNGNGGQPLAAGNIWVVYCRSSQNYAVLEVTQVTNSWDTPRFSFNYYYQSNGSTDFGGSSETAGCTDPLALNYDPDATQDDGSCYYSIDCNGDPDGLAFIDDCGECVGGNTGMTPEWAMDDCGICFGNNDSMDCSGDCFGSAFIDDCAECVGGNTGMTENWAMDCAGVCFGDSYEDDCGVCDDDPSNDCVPAFVTGSGYLSTHPDSMYFNFELGFNSGDSSGMDIMITGNEGTNFGSEGSWFSGQYYPSLSPPSPILFLSPDSTLELIESVPEVSDDWAAVSWEWPGGNGGQSLAEGNIWVVYCRTTHNYAVMEITQVFNSWNMPSFSFNYHYQPDGGTGFGETPQDTEADCSNGLDDDGDGFVDCADPDCSDASNCQGVQTGTGLISSIPLFVYFNFEQGINGSTPDNMDIMVSGNEGANFGSEYWFPYAPAIPEPSQLLFFQTAGSLENLTIVPEIDDGNAEWVINSWDWDGGTAGMPVGEGQIWIVYTTTTHCYAAMEIIQVNPDPEAPTIYFEYLYQPNGTSSFLDSDFTEGCTDPAALNYDPEADIDDGSCYYFVDCNGDPDGLAFLDECGQCVGGATGLEPGWALDDCGECFGDNQSMDCSGVCFGTAFIDDCGVCVGGDTGLEPCETDCSGEPGGSAFIDDCGECVGGSTGMEPLWAMDCAGVCFGDSYEDDCGVCDDDPSNDCVLAIITGTGYLSTHPDSMYFNFELGFNSGDSTGMDIMITGNEGTNFGSEGSWFSGQYYPSLSPPSPIFYLSPDSTLELIESVPEVSDDWAAVSWEWPGGNGGQSLAEGNIWVVYCRTTHNYAVLEITQVFNSWNMPSFSFDYYYQPNGSTSFEELAATEDVCDDDLDNDNDGLTDCDDPDCADDPVCSTDVVFGDGMMSSVSEYVYFNFELGINGSRPDGMDVMISGNEGLAFGSEFYFPYAPGIEEPSLITLWQTGGTLSGIETVPAIDDPGYTWGTISWQVNGTIPLQTGDIWIIFTATTQSYAVMEITSVTVDWSNPSFTFNYLYQPDGTNNFGGWVPPESETDCSDGIDNDGDDLIDCDDPDCYDDPDCIYTIPEFGSGALSANPEEAYFSFELGLNGSGPDGMDILISANGGLNFGSEQWFDYTPGIVNPGWIMLLEVNGSLESVSAVPAIDDMEVFWAANTWELTEGLEIQPGNLFVFYSALTQNYIVIQITNVFINSINPSFTFNYLLQTDGTTSFIGWQPAVNESSCEDGIDNDNNGLTDCDDPECHASAVCDAGDVIQGTGGLSAGPETVYFSFELGENSGVPDGMDIMISASFGLSFGSEFSFEYAPPIANPSMITLLSSDGSLGGIMTVPSIYHPDYVWGFNSWETNGGFALQPGSIFAVFTASTQSYAILQITNVFVHEFNPSFTFNFLYQPNGSTYFDGWLPPVTENNCVDGVDNDLNGLSDCDDPQCHNSPVCGAEDVIMGSGSMGADPESVYFSFGMNSNGGSPVGMDIMISGNFGLSFGSESWFEYAPPIANPNLIMLLQAEGSLTDVISVPTIYDTEYYWAFNSWEVNGGTTLQPGNIFVIFSAEYQSYILLQITNVFVSEMNPSFTFNFLIQPNGSAYFGGWSPPGFESVCDDGIDNDNDGVLDCDDEDCYEDDVCLLNIPEYGSGGCFADSSSVYFSFDLNLNSGSPDGMDIMISGNFGVSFGSESWFAYAPMIPNPSLIMLLELNGSLTSIVNVPSIYTPGYVWAVNTWELNGGAAIQPGNVFIIYTASTHSYAALEITNVFLDEVNPGFTFNFLYLPGGSTWFGPAGILGCTDPEALNFNPLAYVDDGSCFYFIDCNGDPDGLAFFDDCGECVGGNTGMTENWAMDCAGVCFGTAYFDECGVCDDDPDNDCVPEDDCAGVPGGDAYLDICGVCVGGTTGLLPNESCVPSVLSIMDVPNDQGGRVYLTFQAAPADNSEPGRSTEGYSVERLDMIDNLPVWVNVESGYAYGQEVYVYEVPTLEDSSAVTDAITEFRVVAGMDEGTWLSDPAAGYSVDNIAPGAPYDLQGAFGQDGVSLSWSCLEVPDFNQFIIYRDDALIGTTSAAEWLDTGAELGSTAGYQISAMDTHGNESELSDGVQVTVGLRGDINNDGYRNVQDIVMIIDMILYEVGNDYERWAGDTNMDGDINILDVVVLMDIILYGDVQRCGQPGTASVFRQGSVVEIISDGQLAGFQLELSVAPDLAGHNLPDEWVLVYENNILLAYSNSAENDLSECRIVFDQSPEVNQVILADRSGTGLTPEVENLPTEFQMGEAYPNPFNPCTSIIYEIPIRSRVELRIFDLLGRPVDVLVNEIQSPGSYTVTWNGSNWASGIYLAVCSAIPEDSREGTLSRTQRLILVK